MISRALAWVSVETPPLSPISDIVPIYTIRVASLFPLPRERSHTSPDIIGLFPLEEATETTHPPVLCLLVKSFFPPSNLPAVVLSSHRTIPHYPEQKLWIFVNWNNGGQLFSTVARGRDEYPLMAKLGKALQNFVRYR